MNLVFQAVVAAAAAPQMRPLRWPRHGRGRAAAVPRTPLKIGPARPSREKTIECFGVLEDFKIKGFFLVF